jgi:hypothetical protein
MSPIRQIYCGAQMCALDSCGSLHYAQPSTYRNVDCALFPCISKINAFFRNTRPLPGIAEAIPFFLDMAKNLCRVYRRR